jgi:hypothetical protein
MASIRERPLAALWVAIAVMVAGRLLDLQWHLSHDEFEGTSEQLQAHWLAWIGVLLVLVVAAAVVRQGKGGVGFRIALLSAAAYVPIAIWHFVEHANGTDPELAHVLLGITNVGMVVGAIMATFGPRRTQRLA